MSYHHSKTNSWLTLHRCLVISLVFMREWIYSVQVSDKQVKNTNNIICTNTLNHVRFSVFSGRWKHAFFFTSPSNSRPNKCIPLHLFLSSKTLIMGIFVLICFLDICNLISLQQEDDTCSQESTSKAYYNQITSAKRQTLLDFMTGWLQGAVSVLSTDNTLLLLEIVFWIFFAKYYSEWDIHESYQ